MPLDKQSNLRGGYIVGWGNNLDSRGELKLQFLGEMERTLEIPLDGSYLCQVLW